MKCRLTAAIGLALIAGLATTGVSAAGTTGVSLWDSTVPLGGADADNSAVELGVRFRSDSGGFITGLRFYKYATNTGAHVGNLWSSAGALLATATFTGESVSGWQ